MNHWNELVAIMNDPKAKEKYTVHNDKDVSYAEYAQILLNGLNTASGAQTKPSIENFVHTWEDFKEDRKTFRILTDGIFDDLTDEDKRKVNEQIRQANRDGYTHVHLNYDMDQSEFYEITDLLQSIEIWESEQPSN